MDGQSGFNPDVPALLTQVQGRRVNVAGTETTLSVAGATMVRFDPDWRVRVLSVLASPSLALILMMLGFYGIVFELMSPGYVLPGVIGAICLLVALFALQLLPFTYTGLALLALGMSFFVAEAFVPTSGALGVGGVVAFVLGSVLLIDTDMPGYGVPLPLILGLAIASVLFLVLVVGVAVKARRGRVVTGREELLGSEGEVLADAEADSNVWARVHGETWAVRSSAPLRKGDRVRVLRVEGLTLEVEPLTNAIRGST